MRILIEIFRQKRIASKVILAFLDHLKPKIFFVDQPWWPTLSAPSPFQNFWIRPCLLFTISWIYIVSLIVNWSLLIRKLNIWRPRGFRQSSIKKPRSTIAMWPCYHRFGFKKPAFATIYFSTWICLWKEFKITSWCNAAKVWHYICITFVIWILYFVEN